MSEINIIPAAAGQYIHLSAAVGSDVNAGEEIFWRMPVIAWHISQHKYHRKTETEFNHYVTVRAITIEGRCDGHDYGTGLGKCGILDTTTDMIEICGDGDCCTEKDWVTALWREYHEYTEEAGATGSVEPPTRNAE